MRLFTFAIIILVLALIACAPQGAGNAVLNDTGVYDSVAASNTTSSASSGIADTGDSQSAPSTGGQQTAAPTMPSRYTVHGTEGELIQLNPRAYDPDNDRLTYSFTKPFDANGRWQTRVGDAGKYTVSIGVSDGKSMQTENIDVVVERANRPPAIDCKPASVDEGELVDMHQVCTVSDEDGDDIAVSYSGWMSGAQYQTGAGDVGVHSVTVTATDKESGQILHTVSSSVSITVRHVDRAPVFAASFPQAIVATENDVITLPRDLITDPDHEQLTFTFGAPFDANGVWRTKLGDAGSYDVDVAASDGQLTTKRSVHVDLKMLNTPPVLKTIPDITVNEGETVHIPVNAYDREGDALKVTISGWMTSSTYTTTYDDAGSYTATVVVSDGVYNVSQVVHITVNDVNRPPVFVSPA